MSEAVALAQVGLFDRRSGMRPTFSAEQEAAIRARAPLVAVSAGAGSGKTTVLVERFIDLVQRDGVSPLEILAITFTEKAAAEMKERIVRRFEERGDRANRRRAESSYISTIHGFCARMLREHPLAAGLDPSFRVMDELTRNVFLDEQLELLYRDDWYVQSHARFPKRFDSERPLLFELIAEAAFLPAEFGTLGYTEAGRTVDQHVDAALDAIREHWRAAWAAAGETLLSVRDAIVNAELSGASARKHAVICDVIRRLAVSAEPDKTLADVYVENTGFTSGLRGDPGIVRRVREAIQSVRKVFVEFGKLKLDAAERLERTEFAPMKANIYAAAASLRAAYAEFKQRHGFLDFEDMQQRALDLLADDAVRESYTRRFRHIVLDEAQDTNDVQMRLIDRLCDGRQSLFLVGDVKQAIYGFRGANAELFQERYAESAPHALSLVDNYRSREGVIDVVNAVGERLWSDGSVAFERLQARFPYESRGRDPRVELWLIEQVKVEGENGNPKLEPADETRDREGIALATRIRAAVDGDDPLTVYDRTTRAYRRARYGDFAILSGTRTPFPSYERALAELGIPYTKDGGREFFLGREVQDLLAVLRVIENPLDDVSLLAALRSPLFGWGDRDLVRLRAVAGDDTRRVWDGMRGFVPHDVTASPEAHDTIRSLRRQAAFVTPAALIEMVCDATAYRAALLLLPRGRAQVANIDQLIEFARATATLDGPSLASFLHRASLAERYLGTYREAPLSVTADDAVVLSTIHGAKGLEWPVVMLAGLDGDLVRANNATRYSAPDGALILGYRNDDGEMMHSARNAPIVERARVREEAEARRLLYVGMTRARERLILSSRWRYPTSRTSKADLGAPVEWFVDALGIEAPAAQPVPLSIGGAAIRLENLSPAAVSPLRDAALATTDVVLAAARIAVRDGEPVRWADASTVTGAVATSNGEPTAPDVVDLHSVIDRVFGANGPAWTTNRSLALTTVTQLVYFFRCPLVYYFDLVLQIDEHPKARGKAGAAAERRLTALERGTEVHELLERADLGAAAVEESTRLAAQLTDVADGDRSEIEAMAARVLASPLMERARSATLREREYPFYLRLGDTTVQGVIDLVFREADGTGVVVDYKSNDLSAPRRLATLSEFYRPQVELYALAARQAGLIEPSEAVLYFLNGPAAVTTPVDARRLQVVEEGAHDAIGRIGRRDWDTEPGEKCRACGYRKRGFCEVGKRFDARTPST